MAHVTALRLVGEELAEDGIGVTVFVEGEEEAGESRTLFVGKIPVGGA